MWKGGGAVLTFISARTNRVCQPDEGYIEGPVSRQNFEHHETKPITITDERL